METVESLCDNIALIHQSKKILEGTKNDIKLQFKKNEFKLLTDKALDFSQSNFTVKESGVEHERFYAVVSGAGLVGNSLLNFALQQGEVISFSEILPDMNDIFIEVVEKSTIL
jgi:ABC-2 type transport system ATP-binding protein